MKKILSLFVLSISMQVFAQTTPAIEGQILYHTYSGYENWDSELFILKLDDGTVSNISSGWNIDHEMNGVFSPDGSMIVFMGDQKGGQRNWDIFLWTVGGGEPMNLTAGSSSRDEDPKFSPDGSKIVFKSDNDIKEMDLNGNILNNVTNTPSVEESMPYYTADGSQILYAPGVGAQSDIYICSTDGSNVQALVAQPNYQEYFPVVRDEESFFYTGWVSSNDLHDQLYLRYFSSSESIYLPFNTIDADYSDATPVGSQYVVFSSTKSGGKGGYDLYIADINTGDTWSLDDYNSSLNSSWEDLGANYYSTGTPSSNVAPAVTITSPVNNAAYDSPASVIIEVDASDTDGSIDKVAFYQNGILLGSDITSPYSYSWDGVLDGTYVISAVATDNEGAQTTSASVNIIVSSSGSGDFDVPGRIEAEDFTSMSGIAIEDCYDTGGGFDVGGVNEGDWMDYDVNIRNTGNYTLTYRVATVSGGNNIRLKVDGVTKLTTSLPRTGGWQVWQSVSETVSLSSGSHTITIEDSKGSWNLNWFELNETVGLKSSIKSSAESQSHALELYPNPMPMNGVLNLNLPSDKTSTIEIISMSGNVVQSLKSEGQGFIRISLNAKQGLYLVKVIQEKKTYVRKLRIN